MSDQSSNRFIDSLRLFLDIARLRRGPEDLPVDRLLLLITIIAYALLNLVLSRLVAGASEQVVLPLLVELAVALLWLVAVLQLAHKPERFLQTATAVFGFQLVMAPLIIMAAALFLRVREDPVWEVPMMLLLAALGIWTVMVNARILVAATQWPGILCVALIIGEAIVSRLILQALVPELGAAATTTTTTPT